MSAIGQYAIHQGVRFPVKPDDKRHWKPSTIVLSAVLAVSIVIGCCIAAFGHPLIEAALKEALR